MKTTLHIDMDQDKKHIIKMAATSQGQSMKEYLISLVDEDVKKNKPEIPSLVDKKAKKE